MTFQKAIALITLVAVSLIFTPIFAANASSGKQAIFTKEAPAPIGPFSQAIKIGNTTYISGQIPVDPKTGELVKGDFSQQFEQAVINLSEIAKASGGSLDSIVKVTVYVTDLGNFAEINKVMEKYFHKPYPARVAIEIKALPKNATVEIEGIMVKG